MRPFKLVLGVSGLLAVLAACSGTGSTLQPVAVPRGVVRKVGNPKMNCGDPRQAWIIRV